MQFYEAILYNLFNYTGFWNHFKTSDIVAKYIYESHFRYLVLKPNYILKKGISTISNNISEVNTVELKPRYNYYWNNIAICDGLSGCAIEGFRDYYPFGMVMPGRKFNSPAYRYGFNGMEKDDELKGSGNSYDFGARIYDSRLGRWLAVDPKASKYPMMSPYTAFGGNPLYFIDPNGETLVVAGNITQGQVDMKGAVPDKFSSKISVVDDMVVVDMTKEQVEQVNDPGLTALYELANSDKNYLYEVNNDIPNEYAANNEMKDGVYRTIGMTGGSTISGQRRPQDYYVKEKVLVGKKSNGKPKYKKEWVKKTARYIIPPTEGSDASVTVYDDDWESVGADGNVKNRRSMVFHEIVEMFKMNEKKQIRYPTAHEGANSEAKNLEAGDERSGGNSPGSSKGLRKKN